jgi:hypothetical protein
VALPQFAGTRQRVLEAHLAKIGREWKLSRALGSIYFFTSEGILDLNAYAETAAASMEGSTPHKTSNVINISAALRHQRWVKSQKWTPDRKTLLRVETDVSGGGNKVRTLTRADFK